LRRFTLTILNKYKKIQEDLGIIGKSEKMRELVELVASVAPTSISILITGDSGTGKEVFAQAIHNLSPRNKKDMIFVNCGAIPEGLLESELFGHEKGAFTGAIATKKGYFELADGSTIFLDEIGEMPLQTQVKLLRVLESGEFMRVGSGELRKVDARVIAATNRDLTDMVKRNQFRKDLYYRLKAVSMEIPPIRERKEDIPLFINYFSKNIAEDNKLPTVEFTDEAMDLLTRYTWPGNVREIKNFVETIIVLAKGKPITTDFVREQLQYLEEPVEVHNTLPIPAGRSVEQAEREIIYKALLSLGIEIREIKNVLTQLVDRFNGAYEKEMYVSPYDNYQGENEIKPLDEIEKEMIEKALHIYKGNRRKASRALNLSERTLYRKIKEYDLGES